MIKNRNIIFRHIFECEMRSVAHVSSYDYNVVFDISWLLMSSARGSWCIMGNKLFRDTNMRNMYRNMFFSGII